MTTRSAGPQLPHSHSSPGSIDPAPLPDVRKSGKVLAVEVHFLDDSVSTFQIQYKAAGKVLFDQVCRVLNLLEVDYFGLEYSDSSGTKYWLDYEKPICRQIGLSLVGPVMYFSVKFYTPDPAQLEEEFTRYLFSLQIKKDLAEGVLQCSDNTAALMASYIVQASCGDFVTEDYPDHTYLSSYKFVPHQDSEVERKIMENHKKHVGQSPAESDLNLLETARRCELYGIRMTPAKDHEGVPLNLSIAHMGVIVFQNFTKINTFSWAKIRKLSFKRKKFLIKLHPEGYGYYKDTVEFFFESRNECKNFWKKCIENHAFFRCTEVKKVPRPKARLFSRGSSFRYSGRTQKQIVEYVRENYVKRQPFQRSTSLRLPGTSRSGVGTSISAQPLLPVSTSLSCGSVVLTDEPSRPSPAPKPPSVSEPSSPHRTILANGSLHADVTLDQSGAQQSLASPELDRSQEGVFTPSQDTDDNISHDSYHLEEGEPKTEPVQSPIQAELNSSLSFSSPRKEPKSPTQAKQDNSIQFDNQHQYLRGLSSDDENLKSPIFPTTPKEEAITPVSPRSEGESEVRRKRQHPTDRAYFIAKELLMTERSYKKDLEVIKVWFHEEVEKEENMPVEVLGVLLSLFDALYKEHCSFLRALEHRLAAWEGRNVSGVFSNIQGIGGLLADYIHIVEYYDKYVDKLPMILERINNAYRYNPQFEQVYRNFEHQKVCYLPLTSFLLRPTHRLLHYCNILERLLNHYDDLSTDKAACEAVYNKLKRTTDSYSTALAVLENYVKLMELQRDLLGVDNLIQPGREFLREGCLQKLSKKGYQQRMFFLFSDVLFYASRAPTQHLQFKVHGQLPLQGVMVEETEPKLGNTNCFTIYGANRALMVASNCEDERRRWMTVFSDAIDAAHSQKDDQFYYSSLQSCSSSDERLDKMLDGHHSPHSTPPTTGDRQFQHRSNTTVHVCWHRNTSVGREDYHRAVVHYLSGYLLRKFKNSSGWQKLWVVFTNFCLFFYKSYQDSCPLASLPLLGYTVTTPGEKDNVNKDYVFKLQFKNHIYFFRAESEYTFERWMEVIGSATH